LPAGPSRTCSPKEEAVKGNPGAGGGGMHQIIKTGKTVFATRKLRALGENGGGGPGKNTGTVRFVRPGTDGAKKLGEKKAHQ